MKLTLAEPKYLKESIAIISELVNETRIKVNKDGLELVAMDPANVAMVNFRLLSSAFAEYQVDSDVDIAINLNNFKQILRRAKPNDVLQLEVAEDRLVVQLKANSVRTFSLPIIDIEEKEQKVPSLEFPIKVEMTSDNLNQAVEDVDIIADAVSFIADSAMLSLKAEGDLNTASIDIKAGDDITIEAQTAVKSKYSVEYLKKMIQGSKLADKVTVQFNKDYPLKLSYTEIDKVLLEFILAPRVENE